MSDEEGPEQPDESPWSVASIMQSAPDDRGRRHMDVQVARELSAEEYDQLRTAMGTIARFTAQSEMSQIVASARALHDCVNQLLSDIAQAVPATTEKPLTEIYQRMGILRSDWGRINALIGQDTEADRFKFPDKYNIEVTDDVPPKIHLSSDTTLTGEADDIVDFIEECSQNAIRTWSRYIRANQLEISEAILLVRRTAAPLMGGDAVLIHPVSQSENQSQSEILSLRLDLAQVLAEHLGAARAQTRDIDLTAEGEVGAPSDSEDRSLPDVGEPSEQEGHSLGSKKGTPTGLIDFALLTRNVASSAAGLQVQWTAALNAAMQDPSVDFEATFNTFISVVQQLLDDEAKNSGGENSEVVIRKFPVPLEEASELLDGASPDEINYRRITAKLHIFSRILKAYSAITAASHGQPNPAGVADWWTSGAFISLNLHLDALTQAIFQDIVAQAGRIDGVTERVDASLKGQHDGENLQLVISFEVPSRMTANHLSQAAHVSMAVGDYWGCVFHVSRYVKHLDGIRPGWRADLTRSLSGNTGEQAVATITDKLEGFVSSPSYDISIAVHLAGMAIKIVDMADRWLDRQDQQ